MTCFNNAKQSDKIFYFKNNLVYQIIFECNKQTLTDITAGHVMGS